MSDAKLLKPRSLMETETAYRAGWLAGRSRNGPPEQASTVYSKASLVFSSFHRRRTQQIMASGVVAMNILLVTIMWIRKQNKTRIYVPFSFFLQYVLHWGLTEVGSAIRVAHDVAEVYYKRELFGWTLKSRIFYGVKHRYKRKEDRF